MTTLGFGVGRWVESANRMLNKKEKGFLKKVYYLAALGQYMLITSVISIIAILPFAFVIDFVLGIPNDLWIIQLQILIYSGITFALIGSFCLLYTQTYSTMSSKYIKISENAGIKVDKTKGLDVVKNMHRVSVISNVVKPVRILTAIPVVGNAIGLCIIFKEDADKLAKYFDIKLIRWLPACVCLVPLITILSLFL